MTRLRKQLSFSPSVQAVQSELARWRKKHGGPGRHVPAALWDKAVAVARIEGAGPVARALGLRVERLERRVSAAEHEAEPFVEISDKVVDTPKAGAWAVVEIVGPRSERLRLEAPAGSSLATAATVAAFLRELERR